MKNGSFIRITTILTAVFLVAVFMAALVSPPSTTAAPLPCDPNCDAGTSTDAQIIATMTCYSEPKTGFPATFAASCSTYQAGDSGDRSGAKFADITPATRCYFSSDKGKNFKVSNKANCDKYQASVASYLTDPKTLATNPIIVDLKKIIDIVAIGVSIVVIGSIIFAGIQYITAGDNTQTITAAKQRIFRSLFALLAFIFTWALLMWLIPGGIWNA